MGARPPCGGALQVSVPRPHPPSFFQKTSVRFLSLLHASNGSSKPSMRP